MDDFRKVDQFIRQNWHKTIRTGPEDAGTLIGVPFPYTVPSIRDNFQEMYYWDLYYTNLGLIGHGLIDLAKNNTENLAYLAMRYGHVPNGNRTFYLVRSQPPHLSMMVRDVFEVSQDHEWLGRMYRALEKEYAFWMTRRITALGLNRYFFEEAGEDPVKMYNYVNTRRFPVPAISTEEKVVLGRHFHADCESGWDFSPRFEGRCADCLPVDLNSNLFAYEMNFAHFSGILKLGDEEKWLQQAQKRRQLIDQYLWDDRRGFYYDYLIPESRHCTLETAAAFYPLWAGCANESQAAKVAENTDHLEYPFGISACRDSAQTISHQWDYPNAWAPLHYACVRGLQRYGFSAVAARISEKFLSLVTRNFLNTGDLWEKYNAVDGTLNVNHEYPLPALMGWTAGVFTALLHGKESITGIPVLHASHHGGSL